MPGTYFATPWRLEQGGLLDLGPHVLDGLVGTAARGGTHVWDAISD